MISQSEILGSSKKRAVYADSDFFPAVVKRSYERARATQEKFSSAVSCSGARLPEESCICINGSISRLESVQDSDIDYVLIWNDSTTRGESNRRNSIDSVEKINRAMTQLDLRPCNSFSCHQPISDLLSTENLFNRYCILTLVDSTFIAGSQTAYGRFLNQIERKLDEYAIGLSAETQVIRTLVWYIHREGWVDQLHFGTSVNRFSRLIQLFTTILSLQQFGIGSTRATKTTWLRIERLEPFLPAETSDCLKKLWTRALELKETRGQKPMLRDSSFVGISQLIEIWQRILSNSQVPGG